jgi:hypothetical protein
MSTGTIKWFAQALLDLGNKIHDLDGDDLRIGIVNNTTVPEVNTAAPHWGGTGTTNFAANQVSTAGTSYSGPIALANKSWTIVSGVPTLRADDITLPIDASGFNNGAFGIIFNNSDPNKRGLGLIEMSAAGTLSVQSAQVVLNFGGAGTDVLTLTQP